MQKILACNCDSANCVTVTVQIRQIRQTTLLPIISIGKIAKRGKNPKILTLKCAIVIDVVSSTTAFCGITFLYQRNTLCKSCAPKESRMIFSIEVTIVCCRSVLQLSAGASGRDSFNGDLVGELWIKLGTPLGHQLGKPFGLKGWTESRGRAQPPGGQVIVGWLIASQSI